jgi:uncharacterized protein (DUF697 family)
MNIKHSIMVTSCKLKIQLMQRCVLIFGFCYSHQLARSSGLRSCGTGPRTALRTIVPTVHPTIRSAIGTTMGTTIGTTVMSTAVITFTGGRCGRAGPAITHIQGLNRGGSVINMILRTRFIAIIRRSGFSLRHGPFFPSCRGRSTAAAARNTGGRPRIGRGNVRTRPGGGGGLLLLLSIHRGAIGSTDGLTGPCRGPRSGQIVVLAFLVGIGGSTTTSGFVVREVTRFLPTGRKIGTTSRVRLGGGLRCGVLATRLATLDLH